MWIIFSLKVWIWNAFLFPFCVELCKFLHIPYNTQYVLMPYNVHKTVWKMYVFVLITYLHFFGISRYGNFFRCSSNLLSVSVFVLFLWILYICYFENNFLCVYRVFVLAFCLWKLIYVTIDWYALVV